MNIGSFKNRLTLKHKVLSMKEKQDYLQDIAEIRSMMERSSKFAALSGWAGIMAGIYALGGAFVAYRYFSFHTPTLTANDAGTPNGWPLMLVATAVLGMALGTAVWLSYQKAVRRGQRIWTATARQLAATMAVPLVTGGLLCLALASKGLMAMLVPVTLLFYGIALYFAGRLTYTAIRNLGLIQVALGLAATLLPQYGLVLWALGFGVFHIIYGIYIHNRYER